MLVFTIDQKKKFAYNSSVDKILYVLSDENQDFGRM